MWSGPGAEKFLVDESAWLNSCGVMRDEMPLVGSVDRIEFSCWEELHCSLCV